MFWLIGLGVVLVIGAIVWMKWVTTTAAGTSTAGQAVTKAIDTATAMSAYASLTAIRQLDSVEADPGAVAACDLLRNVVTAWKRPAPVIPVADLAALQVQVAALAAKIPASNVAPSGVSEIKA